MSKQFKVDQIDHVEVNVPDRYKAAEWYDKALGLSILPDHKHWADDDRGPLMISSDNGNTMIALFVGQPQGTNVVRGFKTVAFRVSGENFINFAKRKPDTVYYGIDGKPLDSLRVVDHEKAFSVYFHDPCGNELEVTTYDYDYVKSNLEI
ncbi:MAG: VOC family protein [candidate division Zixibacteria bacterium]|nr:VOC family protein [candidate division Zixibacteria bacterium]